MKFIDTATNLTERFSIGRETESGRYYLSIPVAGALVDYEDYFEITPAMHDNYPANLAALSAFANQCRRHEHDDLRFFKPRPN